MKIVRWAAALAVAAMIVASPAFLPTADVVRAESEDDVAKDPVIASWEAYQSAQADNTAKRREASAELRKVTANADATAAEKSAAQQKYRETLASLNKELEAPRDAFYKQLAAANLDKYADKTEMLETGLIGMGHAARQSAPADAVRHYEAFLKHCGNSDSADTVRANFLPMALAGTGNIEGAVKRCNELLESVGEQYKPTLLMRIGDYSAATGDLKAATKAYEKGLALCDGEFDRRDPRNGAKRYLGIRASLTGKDAPNVDSETWLGGEAQSLAEMKGKVVIIDFWATWCGPCRVAMPGLDHIYKENKDKGVVVIGLTRFYANGFLPNNSSNLSVGESVRGITEENYVAHLEEFKKRSELSYPFVVGQQADFAAYGVTGIPTMAIVNKEGKVAMIVVGAGNDALIEACVKNLIK